MKMKIYRQSAFDRWPFEDKSVQAIITSPPYWGLRKYDIPDVIIENWKGQYGLEPSYSDYISHTLLWCQEAWRVLRDDGVFFLNLGDSYCSGGSPLRHKGYNDPKYPNGRNGEFEEPTAFPQPGIKPKCKLLIPHRVAIALIDEGWILRNDIIWHKPNALPESVRDRFSKRYEYIFMFVKNQKYYFNLDAVKMPFAKSTYSRARAKNNATKSEILNNCDNHARDKWYGMLLAGQKEGANPGDVWEIPNKGSSELHFAMWPEALCERMILCSTRPGDTVLDPFAGSGTTLRVAERLNRIGYGIDLGYEEIQRRRLDNIQKELPLMDYIGHSK